LAAPPTFYDEFIRGYRLKRDLLVDGLTSVGFRVFPPQGTYFVLADHTPFGFTDDAAFCRHLIEKIGVAAIPPGSFYDDATRGRDLVRFAFCKTEETLKAAIARMKSRMKRVS